MRRQARGLIFIGVILVVSIVFIAIPTIDINIFGRSFERGNDDSLLGLTLGLDLQGGTHLVYQASKDTGEAPTADEMEVVRQTINNRVNQFGLSEPTVQLLGTPPDRVLIQIPGLSGASVSVGFAGNAVTQDDLEEFFRGELGHPEASVRSDVDDSGAELLIVNMDELRGQRLDRDGGVLEESEADQIRVQLGERFPATLRVIYSAPSGTSTPVFAEPTVGGINELLNQIDRGDARVSEVGTRSFSVLLTNPVDDAVDADGNVTEGEATRLRKLFNERFGPPLIYALTGQIVAYTVGGGVQQAKQLIGETAQLEFRERTCGPFLDPGDGTDWPPDGLSLDEWLLERCSNPNYFSETVLPLTGANLEDAFAGTQPGIPRPVVNIVFDGEGSDEFFEVTDRIARTRGLLAIYLDGKELVAPSAQQGISGGRAFIQGPDFTPERTRTIAIQLKSGALPVDLTLTQERNVDATLGGDTLRKSVIAGAIGLALVLVYMIIYYRGPGVVAALALILYASIVLAIFKIAPVTLTLSGIAALILTIGTAVDANILISERTKEELRAGRTLFAAINEGFARAWPSIRDSNVATLITSVVLFWFGDRLGTSVMQGFALTLGIGTLVSMFTAYFASRVISRTLASTPLGNRLTLWVPVGEVGAERATRTEQAAQAGD
ncbi:MAG: protein translocase subunit SecD [Chloroflexi bacterium]|nr:protein translocase subunit SecD [Chloroflexota bacterium]